MKDCCEVADVPREQRRILLVVLCINAVMFLTEFSAGLLAGSTALLADSVDMLGDAIVYGFSLYVVSRSRVWKARASLLKGVVMAGFAVGVLAEALGKAVRGGVPTAEVIGGIGLAALAANLACLALLWRRRSDDVNMQSAWLCSLNDVVGNVGVLVAAAGVSYTGSGWPDVAIGLAIAAMFGTSGVRVLVDARRELVQPDWRERDRQSAPGPVAHEIARSEGHEGEAADETDHRDVHEGEAPCDGGHAAARIQDPADGDRPHETARVARHRMERERGPAAPRVGAPGGSRGQG